jgi:hypothetical protein
MAFQARTTAAPALVTPNWPRINMLRVSPRLQGLMAVTFDRALHLPLAVDTVQRCAADITAAAAAA